MYSTRAIPNKRYLCMKKIYTVVIVGKLRIPLDRNPLSWDQNPILQSLDHHCVDFYPSYTVSAICNICEFLVSNLTHF